MFVTLKMQKMLRKINNKLVPTTTQTSRKAEKNK